MMGPVNSASRSGLVEGGFGNPVLSSNVGVKMPQATAISERAGEGKEDEVASGHEGRGQTIVRHRRKRVELEHVIFAERVCPMRAQRGQALAQARSHIELGPVALAVVEADGFDAREAFEPQARQTVESCPPENRTRAN